MNKKRFLTEILPLILPEKTQDKQETKTWEK